MNWRRGGGARQPWHPRPSQWSAYCEKTMEVADGIVQGWEKHYRRPIRTDGAKPKPARRPCLAESCAGASARLEWQNERRRAAWKAKSTAKPSREARCGARTHGKRRARAPTPTPALKRELQLTFRLWIYRSFPHTEYYHSEAGVTLPRHPAPRWRHPTRNCIRPRRRDPSYRGRANFCFQSRAQKYNGRKRDWLSPFAELDAHNWRSRRTKRAFRGRGA
jgi:hypothetical protein